MFNFAFFSLIVVSISLLVLSIMQRHNMHHLMSKYDEERSERVEMALAINRERKEHERERKAWQAQRTKWKNQARDMRAIVRQNDLDRGVEILQELEREERRDGV